MAIDLSTDKSTSEYNMVLSASLFNDTYNFSLSPHKLEVIKKVNFIT